MTHADHDARAVPLVEQLESVPVDARQMIEIGPTHHRNIPYGRMCREAAAALRASAAREAALREALRDLAISWARAEYYCLQCGTPWSGPERHAPGCLAEQPKEG